MLLCAHFHILCVGPPVVVSPPATATSSAYLFVKPHEETVQPHIFLVQLVRHVREDYVSRVAEGLLQLPRLWRWSGVKLPLQILQLLLYLFRSPNRSTTRRGQTVVFKVPQSAARIFALLAFRMISTFVLRIGDMARRQLHLSRQTNHFVYTDFGLAEAMIRDILDQTEMQTVQHHTLIEDV